MDFGKLHKKPLIIKIKIKLYDMWSETHYREDEYWSAHENYRPFMIRFHPDFNYKWNEQNQHCGRFPMNTFPFKYTDVNWGVKHFGWAKKEDRIAKFERYKELDPDGIYGIDEQYSSILDTYPKLIKWKEGAK